MFISFLFVFISGLAVGVRAQETAGIRVQPTLIEERVDPGERYSQVLRVTNLGTQAETFSLTKRDITGIRPDGTPEFAKEGQERTGFEVSDWIRFERESVRVGPRGTESVPFTIRVPANAGPGGHFGAIIVTSQPPELKGIGAAVAFGASTVVSLRVSGQVIEEADIREFRTDQFIYRKPEVKFITKVENSGNVLVRPRGPLEITDSFGKKVATLVVNPEAAAILPDGSRTFETSWQGEGLIFGRYQVVMSLSYGEDEKKTISRTLSFWVIPMNIILWVAAGILGVIAAAFIFARLAIRRALAAIGRQTGGAIATGRLPSRQLRRHRVRPISRLALVSITLLLFTLLFLVLIFIAFA